jgi:hypothetical protein
LLIDESSSLDEKGIQSLKQYYKQISADKFPLLAYENMLLGRRFEFPWVGYSELFRTKK